MYYDYFSRFREIERILGYHRQLYSQLINTPAFNIMQEMTQRIDYLTSPALREIQRIAQRMVLTTSGIQQIAELRQKQITSMSAALVTTESMIAKQKELSLKIVEAVNRINFVYSRLIVPRWEYISRSLLNLVYPKYINWFPTSLARDVSDSLISEYKGLEITESNLDEFFNQTMDDASERVLSEIDGVVTSEQSRPIIDMGWISILVTVLLFVLGIHIADISYEKKFRGVQNYMAKKFNQLEELIDTNTKSIIAKIDSVAKPTKLQLALVQRATVVKADSSVKSDTITTLHPKQLITIVEESYEWAYIEYFDYTVGTPNSGWIRKKFLQKVE